MIILSINFSGCLGGAHERRLLNDLMTQYQKLERPVMNESQAVTLKFGLTLQQIMDVVSILLIFYEKLQIKAEKLNLRIPIL